MSAKKYEQDNKGSRRPLFDALMRHKHSERQSFHVPGHKNGINWESDTEDFSSIFSFDQTEVTGLDYLHEAEGVLKDSQQLLTAFYDSQQSYYLVNGSTVGNLAMVLAALQKGDRVFVDRNCHQSIIHALELAEAEPVFLMPEVEGEQQTPTGISLTVLKKAFESYPEVVALVLTYPTYDGQTYPLKPLLEYARERNCRTLVDEAHGPHFVLGSPFPESALTLGADIVVQSAHKMLPSFTQTAYLHIGKNAPPTLKQDVERYLHMLQSSSPSYLFMLGLEYARWFMEDFTRQDVEATIDYRGKWKKEFRQVGLEVQESDDPLKLLISWSGHSGHELAACLEKQGIFGEKADAHAVLLTFPLLKAGSTNQEKLQSFPIHLPKVQNKTVHMPKVLFPVFQEQSALALSYLEQKRLITQAVLLEEAAGRVSAANIVPYPPGIPLILKGEAISHQQLDQLRQCLKEEIRVVGMESMTTLLVYKKP